MVRGPIIFNHFFNERKKSNLIMPHSTLHDSLYRDWFHCKQSHYNYLNTYNTSAPSLINHTITTRSNKQVFLKWPWNLQCVRKKEKKTFPRAINVQQGCDESFHSTIFFCIFSCIYDGLYINLQRNSAEMINSFVYKIIWGRWESLSECLGYYSVVYFKDMCYTVSRVLVVVDPWNKKKVSGGSFSFFFEPLARSDCGWLKRMTFPAVNLVYAIRMLYIACSQWKRNRSLWPGVAFALCVLVLVAALIKVRRTPQFIALPI